VVAGVRVGFALEAAVDKDHEANGDSHAEEPPGQPDGQRVRPEIARLSVMRFAARVVAVNME